MPHQSNGLTNTHPDDWQAAICVDDPLTGKTHRIRNACEAKALLERSWQHYHGSRFYNAEHACYDVASGHSSESEARAAFIAAAIEAHLHVHS